MVFHFNGAKVVQQEFGDLLDDNCVLPLVDWLLSFNGDGLIKKLCWKKVATDKDILIEDLLQLSVERFHDFELLECLKVGLVTDSLVFLLSLTTFLDLWFRLEASCGATSFAALLLYKINLVSIYDSFVFALDSEVISDQL